MKAKNETKNAVSEARTQTLDALYQSLKIKEGEKSIYWLAKGRERKTRDFDQVKCVKDEEDKGLVQKKDIKDRWKMYFYNLFNEGYDSHRILADSTLEKQIETIITTARSKNMR